MHVRTCALWLGLCRCLLLSWGGLTHIDFMKTLRIQALTPSSTAHVRGESAASTWLLQDAEMRGLGMVEEGGSARGFSGGEGGGGDGDSGVGVGVYLAAEGASSALGHATSSASHSVAIEGVRGAGGTGGGIAAAQKHAFWQARILPSLSCWPLDSGATVSRCGVSVRGREGGGGGGGKSRPRAHAHPESTEDYIHVSSKCDACLYCTCVYCTCFYCTSLLHVCLKYYRCLFCECLYYTCLLLLCLLLLYLLFQILNTSLLHMSRQTCRG